MKANSYAVIGLGLFGGEIAKQLYESGATVIAIDVKSELVDEYANSVTKAVVADAKKREVLRQLGVDKCDCAIMAITEDLAASVLVTMNLKALGIPQIICKAQNATDGEVLETLGATQVIIPEKLTADRLCKKLISPNVLEYIEISDNFSILEIGVPEDWVGHSIIDINVRAKYGINIIAIRRNGEIIVSFGADFELKTDDILVLLGGDANLEKVQNL